MNMYNPYEWAGRYSIGLADHHHAELFNLAGSMWFVFTSVQWQGVYVCRLTMLVVYIRFYRAMLCVARTMPLQGVRLSVRPSVCLTRACILSKQPNMSSNFSYRHVDTLL